MFCFHIFDDVYIYRKTKMCNVSVDEPKKCVFFHRDAFWFMYVHLKIPIIMRMHFENIRVKY